MLRSFVALAFVFGCGHIAKAQEAGNGYLIRVYRDEAGRLMERTEPYKPQSGDMVFYNDHKRHWEVLYKMVGSDGPYHAGLVFQKRTGEPALVEAGPDDTLWCRIMELSPRFHVFKGDIHVRQLKTPLSPEQNERMTDFACDQDGKRYALWRLLLQGTPFCCRAPVRKALFGRTDVHRHRWLCAELVVAGCTVAGVFDPNVHRANTIYPRDIVADDNYDLSCIYHSAQRWTPSPFPPRPFQDCSDLGRKRPSWELPR